jgi:hypothetical protein
MGEQDHRGRGGRRGAGAAAALLLLLAPAAGAPCGAIELQQALAEMDVSLELPASIEMVEPVDQEDVDYQLAFRFIGARYEVRMSLFPQSWLVRQSCDGDIEQYVPLFTLGLAASIAKDGMSFSRSADLPPATVRREFGADRGMTALLKGNRSDFGRGYSHIAVALLYKIEAGIVALYFLYNEPGELEMEGLDFGRAYYCFRFNEKLAR